MSDRIRCRCPRCTIRGLMGPAVVITVGVLFLLQQMRGGNFGFENTYPVILIVIGAILLGASLAPMDGHISSTTDPQPAAPSAQATAVDSTPSLPPGQGQ